MADAFALARRRRAIHGWLLLSPALVMLTAFAVYPCVAPVWTSLVSRGACRAPSDSVGVTNYQRLLEDPTFRTVGENNLLTAFWANARIPARGFPRTAHFTPTVRPIITAANLWLSSCTPGFGAPCMASAFGIFLMRQAFKQVPKALDETARIEGCSLLGVLWRLHVPAARPTCLGHALVSVSIHWNNFLWPLIVTKSGETRSLTARLSIFAAPENGVDISGISAAIVPLVILFLVVQRQVEQAFLRAGIK